VLVPDAIWMIPTRPATAVPIEVAAPVPLTCWATPPSWTVPVATKKQSSAMTVCWRPIRMRPTGKPRVTAPDVS
jgi:hypothetical protein